MSNLTDLISAGGGGSLPVNIVLTSSQTWVPPVDGTICIHVIGAGGGGFSSTGNPNSGGAGGYCKKTSLAVTTSGSFTVVVGAKGRGGAGGNVGLSGGNSTVAGTGLSSTLTANGGTGATSSAVGTGGSATNGDVNNTGGNGSGGNECGGGAVGIYGTGETPQPGATYANRGGESDSQAHGFESMSGYGYLVGGKAGKLVNINSAGANYIQPTYAEIHGGPLSGGGAQKNRSSNTYTYVHGGDGGIGAGGGGCRNSSSASYAVGGDGGSGCVIIQYLPA